MVSGSESSPEPHKMTYGELQRLAHRVANGVENLGVPRGARLALYMPMTPESVAIYLGVILAGRCAVGIADASAPEEFEKRGRIADARAVFTIDSYVRGGKEHKVYEKVVAAGGPPAIVLSGGDPSVRASRKEDRTWTEFLSDSTEFDAVPRRPEDATNILFSSGTTKDPKAIPWTHVTPIKSAADAYLHQDVHPSDVLAWPTSFGWMMGPWLTYASLVNGAAMALFVGDLQRRVFGGVVAKAGVTNLGGVPKPVRGWEAGRTVGGVGWGKGRLFRSTAGAPSPGAR